MSRGSEAYSARSKEWQEQTRVRKARAARQKAAREALAYDDAPRGMTTEALIAYHRQMKADCLRRMGLTA